MRSGLPTSNVPLARRTHRPTIHYWLAATQWGGLGSGSYSSPSCRKTTSSSSQPTHAPGQWVWLSTRDLRLRLPCRKLSPRYVGPFKMYRQITSVSFSLELPSNYRISPTFHGGPRGETEEGAQPQTPLPFLEDGEEAYRVHELLDSRGHPPVSGWLGGVRSWGAFLGQRRRHPSPYPHWGISKDASRETGPSTSGETKASHASSRQEPLAGGGLCYRGGSRTASSTPPEETLTWILVSCHSDSISHFPSYLGLINHPHLFPIYTHI